MKKEEALEKIESILDGFYNQDSSAFEPGKTKIMVGFPVFDKNETLKVIKCLLETRLSQGKYVQEFESRYANYIGVKHGVAVNSGSSANLLAFSAFIENNDIKKGEEVIMPAATFATVASPAIQLGLKPVFVDVDEKTYNMNPKEIEKAVGDKTRIIMAVHSLGLPADMKNILEISDKNNLRILEDACEAHGSSIDGKNAGSFGDMSTFSFFVAHNMTTGEGGMILTEEDEYENILRSVREFGRINQNMDRFGYQDKYLGRYDKRYVFERLGFNVRMTDIAASFGIEQLKKLDGFNDARLNNSKFFIEKLKKYSHLIQTVELNDKIKHTFYSFPIAIKKDTPFSRMQLVDHLENNMIETRPFFAGCIPDQPGFRNQNIKVIGDLKVSRWLKNNSFFIGCHPLIKKEEREFVVSVFEEFLEKY